MITVRHDAACPFYTGQHTESTGVRVRIQTPCTKHMTIYLIRGWRPDPNVYPDFCWQTELALEPAERVGVVIYE